MSWALGDLFKKNDIISRFTNARSVSTRKRRTFEAFDPKIRHSLLRVYDFVLRGAFNFIGLQNVFSRKRAHFAWAIISAMSSTSEWKSHFAVYAVSACCENIVGISTNKREDLSTFDYRPAALNFIFQYGYSRGKKEDKTCWLRKRSIYGFVRPIFVALRNGETGEIYS